MQKGRPFFEWPPFWKLVQSKNGQVTASEPRLARLRELFSTLPPNLDLYCTTSILVEPGIIFKGVSEEIHGAGLHLQWKSLPVGGTRCGGEKVRSSQLADLQAAGRVARPNLPSVVLFGFHVGDALQSIIEVVSAKKPLPRLDVLAVRKTVRDGRNGRTRKWTLVSRPKKQNAPTIASTVEPGIPNFQGNGDQRLPGNSDPLEDSEGRSAPGSNSGHEDVGVENNLVQVAARGIAAAGVRRCARSRAALRSRTKEMAVRVGFEPTEPVKVQRFSRPPDSTTLAPHRASPIVRTPPSSCAIEGEPLP